MRHTMIFIGLLAVMLAYPQFVYAVILTSPFAWTYPVLWFAVVPLLLIGILLKRKGEGFLPIVSVLCSGLILIYPMLGLLSSKIVAGLLPGLTLAVVVSYCLAPRLVFVSRVVLASALLLFAMTNLLSPYAWHAYAILSPEMDYAIVSEFNPGWEVLALVGIISLVPVSALVIAGRSLTSDCDLRYTP